MVHMATSWINFNKMDFDKGLKMRLFVVILCLLPSWGYMDTSTISKFELIEASKYHREEANSCIRELDELVWVIPLLSDQEIMESLIEGALAALVTPGVQTRLIAGGLPIVRKSIISGNTRYFKVHNLLFQIEHHIGMTHFYNLLSLHCTKEYGAADEDSQNLLRYLDELTFSATFCECIKNKDTADGVLSYIDCQRLYILNLIKSPNYDLTVKDFDDCIGFLENLCEVVANIECTPRIIANKIYYGIISCTRRLGRYLARKGKINPEDYTMDFYWIIVGDPSNVIDPFIPIMLKPKCYFDIIKLEN